MVQVDGQKQPGPQESMGQLYPRLFDYTQCSQSINISWQKLNPKNLKFNMAHLMDLVKFGIQANGNIKEYVKMWTDTYGKDYKQQHILAKYCQDQTKKVVQKLIRVFCRKKQQTRIIFKQVRLTSITKLISLQGNYSEPLNKIIQGAAMLRELIIAYTNNYTKTTGEQFAIYSTLSNKRRFEEIIEYIIYIDELSKIHDNSYKSDNELIGKSSQLEATITLNKQSELYKLMFQEVSYIDLYNKAKETITSEYVFNPEDSIKQQKIPRNLKEVQLKPKLMTRRGRIKFDNQKIYHSEHCDRFKMALLKNLKDDNKSDSEIGELQLEDEEIQIMNKQQTTRNKQTKTKQPKSKQAKISLASTEQIRTNEFQIQEPIMEPTEEEIDRVLSSNKDIQRQVDDEINKCKMQIYKQMMKESKQH